MTPFVFLDKSKIAKICALKDNCAEIEGVRGAVREVNRTEKNIKKKMKKENFHQEKEVTHRVKIPKMVTETSYFLKSFSIFLRK